MEPLWGDREVATIGFAEQMPDLMEAAVKGHAYRDRVGAGEECLTSKQDSRALGSHNGNGRLVISPEEDLSYQEEREWSGSRSCSQETPFSALRV